MTKKSRQKLKYPKSENTFLGETKTIFQYFKRLSVIKYCLTPESAPLKSQFVNSKNPAVHDVCWFFYNRVHMIDDSFRLCCLNGIWRSKSRTFCICEHLHSQKITYLAIRENLYSQNNQK